MALHNHHAKELLANLDKLHTTPLGAERVKRNLALETDDVVAWCCASVVSSSSIARQGKNYYVQTKEGEITVNAHSYTIITAHKHQSKGDRHQDRAKDITYRFVEAINQQDVPLLIDMMADDFTFIDTYGNQESKEAMKAGWPGYFAWFPDYLITIDDYIANDRFSVILGHASASYQGNPEKHWEFPAVWKVVTRENQVVIWQVFCDSKKQLDSMDDSQQ